MANQYIKKRGDRWVILNKSGKVLSRHATEEKAEKSFAAMMMNMHRRRRRR